MKTKSVPAAAVASKKSSPLEKNIEAKALTYCKTKNILCHKFVSPNNRGVPDRILIGSNGRVAFLEFKRLGEQPSGLQRHTLDDLNRRKQFAGWVDTYASAVQFIDNFIAWDALSK
jgi:hypothetical protein